MTLVGKCLIGLNIYIVICKKINNEYGNNHFLYSIIKMMEILLPLDVFIMIYYIICSLRQPIKM